MSELADKFDKYKCDKSEMHRYEKVYEPHFKPRRNHPINLLEIGTYEGRSTKAFHEYFPNGNIYTIDYFLRTKPWDLPVLEEKRVHWINSDSTVPELPSLMQEEWGDIEFDFIIDDGAHWPEANLKTFKNCYPRLAKNGTYFIEDVHPLDDMTLNQLTAKWLVRQNRNHNNIYNILDYKKLFKELNKHTVVKHDNRKEKDCRDDSYIIAISDPTGY